MRTTIYLHSSKESNYEHGERLGLKGEALNMFMYGCYEVAVEVEVNESTGETEIISVDGRRVEPKGAK